MYYTKKKKVNVFVLHQDILCVFKKNLDPLSIQYWIKLATTYIFTTLGAKMVSLVIESQVI